MALVHTPAYIQAIADGTVDPLIVREIGFPWSPAMAQRARRSVGDAKKPYAEVKREERAKRDV